MSAAPYYWFSSPTYPAPFFNELGEQAVYVQSVSATEPASIQFTATVSGGISPYSYAWNFGDGSTGTGNPVTHTFSTVGTFTVSCTVTDSIGNIDTGSDSVAITASPTPSASLTLSAVGETGAVVFSGQDSVNTDTIQLYNSSGTNIGNYDISTTNGAYSITDTQLPAGTYSGVYAKSITTGAVSNTVSFTITAPTGPTLLYYTVTLFENQGPFECGNFGQYSTASAAETAAQGWIGKTSPCGYTVTMADVYAVYSNGSETFIASYT